VTLQPAVFVIALVFGFMLAEWRLSMQNEKALRLRGAIEPQGDVYRAMALVYPAAFLLMGIEGVWRSLTPVEEVAGAAPAPAWWVAGLLLILTSKGLKYWAIASLADRWTFKVLVLPGVPLVNRGPYRYVDHPNYIAVIGELLAMMLMMSAWITGPVMTLAFVVILVLRLRTETRALRDPRAR
jgi:methyltransferase